MIPAFGLLAACSTPEDMASTCQSYGFKPGTNSFAQCMQTEAHANDERRRRAGEALRKMSAPPQSTTCQDNGFGRISCTTF